MAESIEGLYCCLVAGKLGFKIKTITMDLPTLMLQIPNELASTNTLTDHFNFINEKNVNQLVSKQACPGIANIVFKGESEGSMIENTAQFAQEVFNHLYH